MVIIFEIISISAGVVIISSYPSISPLIRRVPWSQSYEINAVHQNTNSFQTQSTMSGITNPLIPISLHEEMGEELPVVRSSSFKANCSRVLQSLLYCCRHSGCGDDWGFCGFVRPPFHICFHHNLHGHTIGCHQTRIGSIVRSCGRQCC